MMVGGRSAQGTWWKGAGVRLLIPPPIWRSIAVIPALAGGAYPLDARHRLGAGGAGDPALGTTHADYFFGDIPCTRALSAQEVDEAYELNTGKVIIETLGEANPLHTPGSSCISTGHFAWGKMPRGGAQRGGDGRVARMAWIARGINPQPHPIDSWLMNKHFQRKHGPDAYYGQK